MGVSVRSPVLPALRIYARRGLLACPANGITSPTPASLIMKQGAHSSGKAKGPPPRKTTLLGGRRGHSDKGYQAYDEVEHKGEGEFKNILLTAPKKQMAQALKKPMRKHKVTWNIDYAGKKSAPPVEDP